MVTVRYFCDSNVSTMRFPSFQLMILLSSLQFRALSDQMFRSPEYHKHVRKEVVKQVELRDLLMFIVTYVQLNNIFFLCPAQGLPFSIRKLCSNEVQEILPEDVQVSKYCFFLGHR